jgi:hypothetical protein
VPGVGAPNRQPGHDEIVRLYGRWHPHDPGDAAELLAGYPGLWWIAGGWAIEAVTALARPHGDLDIGIPRTDVEPLRAHVAGTFDVWAAEQGTLRPLVGEIEPLPRTCGNLWLRRSGADPWEYDVLLTDVTPSTWTYKRDQRISLPLEQTLWQRDGVRYLRPEVQLLLKAPGLRTQDDADLDATLPVLDDGARAWLRRSLALAHPGHPWVERL